MQADDQTKQADQETIENEDQGTKGGQATNETFQSDDSDMGLEEYED